MADFALDENLNLLIPTRLIEGTELVVQRIRVRLNTFLGEWLLDSRVGIPYIQWKDAPTQLTSTAIESTIVAQISSIPGVDRVENISAVLDSATETWSVTGLVCIGETDDEVELEIALTPVQGAARVRSSTR